MGNTRLLAAAAATVLFAMPAAHAADLPVAPAFQPAPVEASGWYLRGDIGMSSQQLSDMHQRFQDVTTESFTVTNNNFDSAPFVGIGVGYTVNSWLRTDVTLEYRGRANMNLMQTGNQGTFDTYHGNKSEITGLWNVYADLGTWWCFTPFVGAGVGFSYNRIEDFYDVNPLTNGLAVADGVGSKWNLAWALYAGVAYQVTPTFAIELAYRYINLGDAQSGYFHNAVPAFSVAPGPFEFKNITSNDLKVGFRWQFGEPPPPPPPLMRKG
jgi:opacity protein-like surface antigen